MSDTEKSTNIKITDSAQGYLTELLAKQNTDGIGVRIFVEHPGTPRAECCMSSVSYTHLTLPTSDLV